MRGRDSIPDNTNLKSNNGQQGTRPRPTWVARNECEFAILHIYHDNLYQRIVTP